MNSVSRDKVVDDLRKVVVDTEELLKATAGQAGEKIAEVRGRAEESLRFARARMSRMSDGARAHAHTAADGTNRYVHANPWAAIGMVAAAAMVFGVLIGHRSERR